MWNKTVSYNCNWVSYLSPRQTQSDLSKWYFWKILLFDASVLIYTVSGSEACVEEKLQVSQHCYEELDNRSSISRLRLEYCWMKNPLVFAIDIKSTLLHWMHRWEGRKITLHVISFDLSQMVFVILLFRRAATISTKSFCLQLLLQSIQLLLDLGRSI